MALYILINKICTVYINNKRAKIINLLIWIGNIVDLYLYKK